MKMITRRITVSGKVQGVFYRGWTEANARQLGITGWVRNRLNGEVEILATGSREAVDELIRRCWHGPRAAAVDGIEVEEAESEEGSGFRKRPTF
jgi:acylphosphatase